MTFTNHQLCHCTDDVATPKAEKVERKLRAKEMECTTLKATMTDQLQQYGNDKRDQLTQCTKLQARVDMLEYQMLHGGTVSFQMSAENLSLVCGYLHAYVRAS
jgi:hypothetical protein